MPTVDDLVKGKRYNVFFLETPIRKMQGVKFDVPVSTGKFTKIKDGEAAIEKDEKGRAVIEYFGDNSYRFEEVPSATAVKTPAGTGLNAARALRTPGGRRKTKKSKRRARKTRRRKA
jgi:hypothetical protein